MRIPTLLACAALALLALPACNSTGSDSGSGWRPLFDGHSTAGWRGFGKAEFPAQGWVVEDGWLKHLAKGGGGDIITTEKFTDFEVAWQWRVAPGANSGLKYFI
ncbi:MAG TPA: DUF1080 domain-containing protein, partial [Candidatus Limnocylindria bacterium]|nr:DUF1080 domain-containing protein [Candidatus Limnocylindria bacterium]